MARIKNKEKNDSISKEQILDKKKRTKVLSKEEILEKNKKHFEKIVKKQEARLTEHIKRVSAKEANGLASNTERFYVTNAKLLEQLNIWKESGKILKKGQRYDSLGQIIDIDGNVILEEDNRIIPEEFGKMILMIAQRLSNHSNFKNYSYDLKQDMISYACFKCMQGLKNYNFAFRNAFAYFTTACYNAFVSTITQYYKQINIKKKIAKKAIEKLESTADINASKVLSQFIKDYLNEDNQEESIEK